MEFPFQNFIVFPEFHSLYEPCIRYVSRFLEKATQFFTIFLAKNMLIKQQKLLKMTNSAGKLWKIFVKTSHSHTTYCQVPNIVYTLKELDKRCLK